MYPPNANTIASSPSSGSMMLDASDDVGSPSLSNSLSESVQLVLNSRNCSTPTASDQLSPSMEQGGAMLSASQSYFHSPNEHQESPHQLYQVQAYLQNDDEPLAMTMCARPVGSVSSVQVDCSEDRSGSSDEDSSQSLQYAHHPYSDYQNHNSHLNRSIIQYGQEPMLAVGSPDMVDPVERATSALLSPSAVNPVRRLPLPIQSSPLQMNPPDFFRHHQRRCSSPSGPNVNPNPGMEVVSPVVDLPCHTNYQTYSWYPGHDVPIDSLLPSPVNGIFSYYDQNPFQFFTPPHPSLVTNSPASPANYFPPPQSQHHQQSNLQFSQHFGPSYLTRTPSFPQTMPGHPTGFASYPTNQLPKTNKKGGRRPKEEQQHLPPEEEMKRLQRRARNKEAAARCRKRRLDHMTELSQQVAQLQETQSVLGREIEQLMKEKDELEFVLKTHEPACLLQTKAGGIRMPKKQMVGRQTAGITVTATATKGFAAPKLEHSSVSVDCDDKIDPPLSSASSIKHMKFSSPITTMGSSVNRPDTLHFRAPGEMDSPGVPIITPSKIFTIDPLNMPTGLTPVSNGLSPILSLANAAATLETPTTSVLGMDGGNTGGNTSHRFHPL